MQLPSIQRVISTTYVNIKLRPPSSPSVTPNTLELDHNFSNWKLRVNGECQGRDLLLNNVTETVELSLRQ